MPRRVLLVVSTLVAVVALALFTLREEPGEDFIADSEDGGESLRGQEPDLLGAEPALRGRKGAEDPADEGEAGTEPEAPAKATTHVLVGTVGGLSAGEASTARIEVRLLQAYGWVDRDAPPLVAGVRDDGSYELDLSSVFARKDVPARIEASFDHPAYAVARRKIETRGGRPRRPGGPVELRADATLERALIVEGQVVSEVGDPLEGIEVALLERQGDAFRLNAIQGAVAAEISKSREDGRFRLRAAAPGRFLAAAFSPTLLPACREVVLEEGVRVDAVELRMAPGLEIAGRVTVSGSPLAKARVEAARLSKEPEFRFGFHSFIWRDGRLLPGGRYDEADDDGHYVITGLDVGERGVSVKYVPDVFIWLPLFAATARRVEPPDPAADLNFDSVQVEVRIVSGTEPVKDAQVTILKPGEEQGRNWTLQGSPLRAVLPPDGSFQILVKHDRFEEKFQDLRTQSAGTTQMEVVDLGPPRTLATLVVSLKDAEDKPVTRASLLLEPVEKMTHFGFGMGKVLKSADGVYRLEDLEPGRKALFALPNRSDMEFFGHDLTLREEVELIAGRETQVALQVRPGGRLRVAVRDESGNLVDANATLRDARGRKLPVAYVSGGDDFASMSTGGPGTGSPSTVEPPLEPGEYRLEVSAPGRETKTLDVKVEVGKTTDVDVTLRKL